MATTSRSKSSKKQEGTIDKNENLKQLTLAQTMSSSPDANVANTSNTESRILSELEKLRQENREGHSQTKLSLTKMDVTLQELKSSVDSLEKRTTEVEDRISNTEDMAQRHERAIRYLLHREMDLKAKYEDLQNRSRRNNLRIYQVPEDSEGKDVIAFVKELIKTTLQPAPEVDMRIERAHRAPAAKLNNPTAGPRSLLVKFVDFSVKEIIIRQAWSQRKVIYKDKLIYFDHDYSPELQKRRGQIRQVIKQLKQKNIKAKCIYPAQLRMLTKDGEKTYPTLTEAARALQECGIQVRVDERERMERELAEHRWSTVGGRRARDTARFSSADVKAFLDGDK